MNKQTGVNFIAQVISFAINLSVSFFLTPFIIKNIGVEANGFVALANNFIEYALLFTMAINSMAGRFITIKIQQKNYAEANKYFTSVFFANVFLSIVFTVIFSFVIIFLEKILNISQTSVVDIKILWILIFLNFIISLFGSVFSVSTFVSDRLDKIAICTARGVIIKAIVLVFCYKFFKPYTMFVGVATVFMGIQHLISNMIYKKQLTPELHIKKTDFNMKCIKELVNSGIWNSISQLSSILSSGLDLLITNIFVSGIAMGVLNVSKTISNVLLSLFVSLAHIFTPQLTIAYAKNNFSEIKNQLISSIKLLGFFSSIPIAILIGFGKEFYSLWVPTQDSGFLYLLTTITCFQLVFVLPLGPIQNLFIVMNKVKISSISMVIFSVMSISTVFIGLNFIKNENVQIIYIAAVGAIFSVLRVVIFLPIYGAKCLGCNASMFYLVIIKNMVSVAVLSAIALVLKFSFRADSWIKLIIDCGIVGIIGLISNILILFSRKEISEMVCNLKKKLNRV